MSDGFRGAITGVPTDATNTAASYKEAPEGSRTLHYSELGGFLAPKQTLKQSGVAHKICTSLADFNAFCSTTQILSGSYFAATQDVPVAWLDPVHEVLVPSGTGAATTWTFPDGEDLVRYLGAKYGYGNLHGFTWRLDILNNASSNTRTITFAGKPGWDLYGFNSAAYAIPGLGSVTLIFRIANAEPGNSFVQVIKL